MGEVTEIGWTDSTFNPWLGCQHVSEGCRNCYAESMMDRRYGRVKWGPHGDRVRTSAAYWRQPLTWNKHAALFQAKHGHRQRVFCASLADVFDNQVPNDWRIDLWATIARTPDLDWLLLTKRPENISKMLPGSCVEQMVGRDLPWPWPNVWLGVTAEDQVAYDRRWPILRDIPAAVRFISYEPAIGPLRMPMVQLVSPDWIICGGESGSGYRAMPELWADDIRQQCADFGIAFFFKQMAGKKPIPDRLMVREFPECVI